MQRSADQFAAALRHQATIARLNCAAVTASIDAFDHADVSEARWAPEAVAMGIASLHQLLIPMAIHAVDLEMLQGPNADLLHAQG